MTRSQKRISGQATAPAAPTEPKVEETNPEGIAEATSGATQEAPAVPVSEPAAPTEPKVEFVLIRLLKNYAPQHLNVNGEMVEQGEIKAKVPAGETIRATKQEALKAINGQVALPVGDVYGE